MTCLSCGARWSRTTGPDDIQTKKGLDATQPRSTPPSPGCGKAMRFQQTSDKKQMFLRLQSISPMQKGGARTTYYGITCFTVCALVLGGAASRDSGSANGCRISQLGGQLQHVGSSSRPATRKMTSCWSNSSLFRLLESRDRQRSGQFFQLYPDQQKKVIVAHQIRKLEGTFVEM